MDVYREFFMWAILHEYEEAVKSNTDDTDFFRKVHEILERLDREYLQATTLTYKQNYFLRRNNYHD